MTNEYYKNLFEFQPKDPRELLINFSLFPSQKSYPKVDL